MTTDPRETLARAPMGTLQIPVLAITLGMTGLDGSDALSISCASPEIASERGIDRKQLGIVLSMEPIGMALGELANLRQRNLRLSSWPLATPLVWCWTD